MNKDVQDLFDIVRGGLEPNDLSTPPRIRHAHAALDSLEICYEASETCVTELTQLCDEIASVRLAEVERLVRALEEIADQQIEGRSGLDAAMMRAAMILAMIKAARIGYEQRQEDLTVPR